MLVDFKTKIQSFLDRGESVQIIAPYGFGKSRFGRSLGGLFIDTNLLQTPTEILETIKSSSERKLIIIDSFDQILSDDYLGLFKYLKALRDQHKYQLAYVFLTHKNIDSRFQPLLGDLYNLVSEHVEYLPVLETTEYDLFGFSPTPKQLKEIEKLSGGIPILVKHCVLALRDGLDISQPTFLPEMLKDSLNNPAYTKSQLVQDYLSSQPQPLSASETRLLDLFLSHSNQIVSKDQICQTVYPDVKNYSGVSDHAIDQLIHRLHSKVKNRYTIQTYKGLGYKLTA